MSKSVLVVVGLSLVDGGNRAIEKAGVPATKREIDTHRQVFFGEAARCPAWRILSKAGFAPLTYAARRKTRALSEKNVYPHQRVVAWGISRSRQRCDLSKSLTKH